MGSDAIIGALEPFGLRDKVALITGAASGLGRETARLFLDVGASVVIADLDGAAAERTAEGLSAVGPAIGVAVDVADEASVRCAFAVAQAAFGGIDILVNNAGVMHRDDDLMEATPDTAWAFTFAVNLIGPQALCAAVLPHMIAAKRGVIVTSASNAGVMGTTRPVYGSSKGAVIGMTLALARRHAADGIRANVVLPGAFATPMLDKVRDFPITVRQPRYRPLGRLGDPSEIAGTIAFLASDDAATINGAIVPVDGGATAV